MSDTLTDIKRAAWAVYPPDDRKPFTIIVPDSRQYWEKSGARVSALVEVQPVLEALWAMREQSTFEREATLIEILRQLEKAAQP